MQHIDDGLIHAWLDDALEPGERARVEAHIAACGDCRRRVDDERAIIARAANILSIAAPPALDAPAFQQLRGPAKRRRAVLSSPVRLAWAATVVLAIGMGWFARAWLQTDSVSSSAVEIMSAPVETIQAPQAPQATQAAPSAAPPDVSTQTQMVPQAVPAPAPAAFAAAEWVSASAESAQRESGMPLVRLAGGELVDVATRVSNDRVEVRTRQRVPPDTTTIEFVQVREPARAESVGIAALEARAKTNSLALTEVPTAVQGARQASPPAQREAPLVGRAADLAVSGQAVPAMSVVTVMRDGIVITARATLPHDSLQAMLQRIRE